MASAVAPSVGVCYVRNQLTEAQLPAVLYPAIVSALTLRAIDSRISICLFSEATATQVANAIASASIAMAGNARLTAPFDHIYTAGEGLERLQAAEQSKLRDIRELYALLRTSPDVTLKWSQQATKVASRLDRMTLFMRAPFDYTLFVDEDAVWCGPEVTRPGSHPSGAPIAAQIRALFEQPEPPHVRVLFRNSAVTRSLNKARSLMESHRRRCFTDRNLCGEPCQAAATPASCTRCMYRCIDRHTQVERPVFNTSASAGAGDVGGRPGDESPCKQLFARSQPLGAAVAVRRSAGATAFFTSWFNRFVELDLSHAHHQLLTLHAREVETVRVCSATVSGPNAAFTQACLDRLDPKRNAALLEFAFLDSSKEPRAAASNV